MTKIKSLFVAYVTDKGGFGNITIPDAQEPKNQFEINIIQNAIGKKYDCHAVVINWKAVKG
ncbi:hypothetical protein [Fictibacillus sp. JL2B1089]|uniref:hypothetical protein n=1 Tax=Fictibacillus sp. JL2B1089 TaxID=3399565 RepID=UPI003A8688EC